MQVTVPGTSPPPFVHLDNRTLMLSDGRRAVGFALASAGRWIEETMMIILDEGRATRAQGDRVFGGFLSEDNGSATLYGGSREDQIVVAVPAARLEDLQRAVTDTVHQHPEPHSPDPGRARRRPKR